MEHCYLRPQLTDPTYSLSSLNIPHPTTETTVTRRTRRTRRRQSHAEHAELEEDKGGRTYLFRASAFSGSLLRRRDTTVQRANPLLSPPRSCVSRATVHAVRAVVGGGQTIE
ncbi:hypothetical protein PIB30_032653 [Stylosanthes scabra]|uniref:Uncharacterized protein n=1 Tax=Stylosanthes scabra TaxID=79078 RepID=A0ABU6WCG7_9FABA|nr:hypothetical protein [Stylosanthes scabra]